MVCGCGGRGGEERNNEKRGNPWYSEAFSKAEVGAKETQHIIGTGDCSWG